jgi:TRAP-type mannitol/chloroaromatic compound transport system permease small subunit
VRLEELGQLKKKYIDLIGTGLFYLPACNTVHEPTTLPLAPVNLAYQ